MKNDFQYWSIPSDIGLSAQHINKMSEPVVPLALSRITVAMTAVD